jgi:glyoxylate/hydroxypyruvate reductase A
LDGCRAETASGLGFNVSGWSRTPKQADGITCYAGQDWPWGFPRICRHLCGAAAADTGHRNILDKDLFARMTKRGPLGAPVLINAGRGGLQNEADILSALDQGLLSAVTLDVFHEEPLPPESPFWATPRSRSRRMPRQLRCHPR